MKSRVSRLLATALLAAGLTGLAACGDDTGSDQATEAAAPADGIVVEDGWVRATAGTDDPSMTGAFMTLDNPGDTDVTLTGASSSVAPMVQIHEMAMVDGKMVMREVKGGIVITAGRGKVLMPGGYHVMLMGLTQELAPGDEVDLTLEFSDGSTEELTLPVKAFTEEEPHYHASPGAHPSMSAGMSPGMSASPMQ